MDRSETARVFPVACDFQDCGAYPGVAGRTAGAGSREGPSFMLHITCDLCGKDIVPGDDHRYVVKIEVFAAHDPAEITEADLDDDHMEAVSQLLREADEAIADTVDLVP